MIPWIILWAQQYLSPPHISVLQTDRERERERDIIKIDYTNYIFCLNWIPMRQLYIYLHGEIFFNIFKFWSIFFFTGFIVEYIFTQWLLGTNLLLLLLLQPKKIINSAHKNARVHSREWGVAYLYKVCVCVCVCVCSTQDIIYIYLYIIN